MVYKPWTSEALEAQQLVELRDRWLNPPEWVEWMDEPVPGYPKRPVPRDEDAAKALKKRALTNLYNARPQWLADAHDALDAAVAAAYGLSADISDDEVLRELLALNGAGTCKWLTCGGSLACLALLAGGGAERAGGLVRTGPQTSKAAAGGRGPWSGRLRRISR